MDSKLIDLFREKVNDNGADFVLHRYRNINGKTNGALYVLQWIGLALLLMKLM
ncbi:hypothetical protein [Dysosmobacter sp.]|uniref:hypothetical protein n=1 Tax=Dysosmobacter sp. TaxID=2591382 RepID=UPI00307C238A